MDIRSIWPPLFVTYCAFCVLNFLGIASLFIRGIQETIWKRTRSINLVSSFGSFFPHIFGILPCIGRLRGLPWTSLIPYIKVYHFASVSLCALKGLIVQKRIDRTVRLYDGALQMMLTTFLYVAQSHNRTKRIMLVAINAISSGSNGRYTQKGNCKSPGRTARDGRDLNADQNTSVSIRRDILRLGSSSIIELA